MYFSIQQFENLDKFFRRNLINSITGFKSLNLVGTQNKDKLTNLAPFSQVFHIGANPAYIGLLVRPDSVERHTLDNIENTKEYTLNHVLSSFYKQAHQSSARYQISEFEATGLTPEYSSVLKAPYVKEANIKIGLKLEERVDIKLNGTILIIGSVQEIFVPDDCVGDDGMIDLEKAGTITCSGLDTYHITQKLARLSYAKPDKDLTEI
ncbi:MAG: flavin oxidoreductase [Bacteroidetes bacterium]|nr:MAG: flavin oxidoreductase [Bacteroidota bacterium]TAG86804.1 MAG: flavin oxidoreductase [Bacteroidota bacterium]